MPAAILGTDPVSQLLGGEDPRGFHHRALAVDPFGLARVQPGTLTGQSAGENADATPLLFDLAMVLADPGPDPLTGVP
jgi:hypothetical protein